VRVRAALRAVKMAEYSGPWVPPAQQPYDPHMPFGASLCHTCQKPGHHSKDCPNTAFKRPGCEAQLRAAGSRASRA
jgi:hypothetical protein